MKIGDLVKLVVPCERFGTLGILLSLSQPIGLSKPIATVMWSSGEGKRQHLPEQLELVNENR
jgi:hypothetical protein